MKFDDPDALTPFSEAVQTVHSYIGEEWKKADVGTERGFLAAAPRMLQSDRKSTHLLSKPRTGLEGETFNGRRRVDLSMNNKEQHVHIRNER